MQTTVDPGINIPPDTKLRLSKRSLFTSVETFEGDADPIFLDKTDRKKTTTRLRSVQIELLRLRHIKAVDKRLGFLFERSRVGRKGGSNQGFANT